MFLEIQPQAMPPSPPGLRLRLHSTLKVGDTLTIEDEQWAFDFASEIKAPVETVLTLSTDGTFVITSPGLRKSRASYRSYSEPRISALTSSFWSAKLERKPTEFPGVPPSGYDRAHMESWNWRSHRRFFDRCRGQRSGQLVIDLSGSDGFIGTIMAAARIAAQFEFAFGFLLKPDSTFAEVAASEIQLPIHRPGDR